jgi:hypothetical protein
MSALPPKADMCGASYYVRFGPIADILKSHGLQQSRRPRIRFLQKQGRKLFVFAQEFFHAQATKNGVRYRYYLLQAYLSRNTFRASSDCVGFTKIRVQSTNNWSSISLLGGRSLLPKMHRDRDSARGFWPFVLPGRPKPKPASITPPMVCASIALARYRRTSLYTRICDLRARASVLQFLHGS